MADEREGRREGRNKTQGWAGIETQGDDVSSHRNAPVRAVRYRGVMRVLGVGVRPVYCLSHALDVPA
jgi:hypothetical protein